MPPQHLPEFRHNVILSRRCFSHLQVEKPTLWHRFSASQPFLREFLNTHVSWQQRDTPKHVTEVTILLSQPHSRVEDKELIEFWDIDTHFTFISLPFFVKIHPRSSQMCTVYHFNNFFLKCGILPFIIELTRGANCFNWEHSWRCDFIEVAIIDMAVNYKHMICLPGVVKSEGKKEELPNLLMRFDDLHN